MFRRIQGLFRRYSVRHLTICSPGFALFDESGAPTGYLETIAIRDNRLAVTGWTRADRVALIVGASSIETRPALPRPDVVKSGSGQRHVNVGFHLDLPCETGQDLAFLRVTFGQTRYVYPVPQIPAGQLQIRQLRLLAPFAWALLRAGPAALRWYRRRDPQARAQIKALLGLSEIPSGIVLLPEDMFNGADPPAPGGGPPVTLILPVYNAFSLLAEALERIVRHTDLPWHLVLIEDGSSDARVRPFLRDWVAAREAEKAGRITLLENPENRGFIESVNRGFEIALARGDHVVLINSDAFVPDRWASRLLSQIGGRVASVTPMSNNAEILSAPAICRKSDLEPGLADRVDAAALRLDPETGSAELPTGVGFCMAINIEYLRQVPQFDPEFGRGYGEEVDWCQKVRTRGGRHLGTAALFVEHRGGASFGSAEKQLMVAANNAIISRRYPGYDAEVQTFIGSDPLAPQRLVLGLALEAARQDQPVPIYLAHSLGGGAEKYLQRRLAEADAAGRAGVVLRVGGAWRWQIEAHLNGEVRIAATDDFTQVEALLAPVAQRHIVYSCGVGAPDPAALPGQLLSLKRGAQDSFEVLFHDFFPLSPSYTLLNDAGIFTGVPGADDPDPAHRARSADGGLVSLAEWRAAWGALIAAADDVVVFSQDSGTHVLAAYPGAAAALKVRPHRLLTEVPRVAPPASGRQVIGVLGNINQQKGAAVVVDLAHALEWQGSGRLVLIGDLDPDYALPASAHVHGAYRIEDLPRLVARYGITDWLIPSIWPETFSFTTHEALATGMPVWCFDLGAQAEAVRAAPNGHAIALTPSGNPAQLVLTRIIRTAHEPA